MKAAELTQVQDAVEGEGFDYAFVHYDTFEEIKDPKFHELRKAFLKARKDLAKYLKLSDV